MSSRREGGAKSRRGSKKQTRRARENERADREQQREREEATRLEAIRAAEVERARWEHEERRRLSTDAAQREHEKHLASLRQRRARAAPAAAPLARGRGSSRRFSGRGVGLLAQGPRGASRGRDASGRGPKKAGGARLRGRRSVTSSTQRVRDGERLNESSRCSCDESRYAGTVQFLPRGTSRIAARLRRSLPRRTRENAQPRPAGYLPADAWRA